MSRLLKLSFALPVLLALSSCVHETPDLTGAKRQIEILFTHDTEWQQHEIVITRSRSGEDDGQQAALARYHIQVFPAGTSVIPFAEWEFTHTDLERGDFTHSIYLPEGSFDIYAWSDHAHVETGKSMFYDSSEFKGIIYTEPYDGNNVLKDAYRGMTTVKVEASLYDSYKEIVEIAMERPMASYEFRATDLKDFIDRETSRGRLSPSIDLDQSIESDISHTLPQLSQYKVRMMYTGYMPSKFNNITNRPIDSQTGVEYNAKINVLSEDEALLGFDHVMVNGDESSIPVAMEIYDHEGKLIGRTNSIDVPTKRGRNTIVRGRFLTSQASGGVGIDPDFSGDFNIEIK